MVSEMTSVAFQAPPTSKLGLDSGSAPRVGVFLCATNFYIVRVQSISFIAHRPSCVLSSDGAGVAHEVKFNGFRIQLHKFGREVRLFFRNGKDFTDRFLLVPAAVLQVPISPLSRWRRRELASNALPARSVGINIAK